MTDPGQDKRELRQRLLAARRAMPAPVRTEAEEKLAAGALHLPEVAGATVVAAHVGVGTEPGTIQLLDRLFRRGITVLLPLLRPDDDLDWAAYGGPGSLASAARGLLEPTGERLGTSAIASADVVLAPGLAVDRTGRRLGRGGGSYDRVLGRVPAGRLVAVLLYDDEVLDAVPVEPHDHHVGAAVTPSAVLRFSSE
jgi:5-formyltetrahydrofolate cyclo-ligase